MLSFFRFTMWPLIQNVGCEQSYRYDIECSDHRVSVIYTVPVIDDLSYLGHSWSTFEMAGPFWTRVAHCFTSRLSSRLFAVTQNATYRDAAQLSSDFIQSHLYDGKTILDIIDISNCTSNLAEETYNPGLYIGGLSVLVNQTQNATLENL